MRVTIFNECMMKEETYELCVKGAGLDLPTLEEMGVDKNKSMKLTRVFYFKEEHSMMHTPLSEIGRVIKEHYDIDDNMIVETYTERVLYPDANYDGVIGFTLENLTEEKLEERDNRFSCLQLYAEKDRLNRIIDIFKGQLEELENKHKLLKIIPFKTAKVKVRIELLEEDIVEIRNMILNCQEDLIETLKELIALKNR